MTNKTGDKDKYLNKVQKLLRLSKSASSPHEAASALAKAQAFMRQHNLSEQDVLLTDIGEASSRTAPSDAEKVPKYMAYLAQVICSAFGVKSYFGWRLTASSTHKRVVSFIGPAGREVVAAYAFDVLVRQLRQARKDFQAVHCRRVRPATKVARADLFCEGWTMGAYQAIEALVVSDDEEAMMAVYAEKRRSQGVSALKTRGAKMKVDGGDRAMMSGYVQGQKARIHHGVNGEQGVVKQIGS